MKKRQVLLISMQPLLGEGLQRIFQKLEDVELVCLDCQDLPTVDSCLKDLHPTMVLLAGEREDDYAMHLISDLLKHYEDIPVMWVDLETALLRIYTSRTLSANSSGLIDALWADESQPFDIQISDKQSHPGA